MYKTLLLTLVSALLPLAAAQAQVVVPTPDLEEIRSITQPVITQTAETQAQITPERALELLEEGNERFVTNRQFDRNYLAQVEETSVGQYPFATVLGCIDSRVPMEIVFDTGIGDMFSPRVAGNFVNTDILGSMEFATAVAGSKIVVVLGHTECGAVKGACDHVELGNLTHTLSNISPAVYAVRDIEGPRTAANKDFVQAVAVENVEQTVRNVVERSPIMAGLVANGDLMVIGAMHDVMTGRVTFLEDTKITAETIHAMLGTAAN